jgi:hypothetical protein
MPSTTSNEPFELLMAYLHGELYALENLSRILKPQCTDKKNALGIYQDTAITKEQKQTLRAALAVPTDVTINNTDKLLDFIDNLNKAGYGYGQLADFRYQLKKIYKEPDWTRPLYLATLLTSSISSFFLLNQHQRDRLEAVLLRIAPIIAPFIAPFLLVGLQFYTIIQQAKRTYYEDTYHSYNHRIQRWLVGTLPSLLNLAAYVAIAVVGSMSPISAALFVAASLVAVTDGAHRFYRQEKTEELAELGTAHAIRQENRKARTRQTLEVKIYAAVALAVTVVISCIFPPSIFVVLAYSSLFILIPWTKNSFLNKIHTESSDQLLVDIRALDGSDMDEANQVEQQQTRIQELESELKNYKNPRVTEEARTSQTGMFKKPIMVSAATQTDKYTDESESGLTTSLQGSPSVSAFSTW